MSSAGSLAALGMTDFIALEPMPESRIIPTAAPKTAATVTLRSDGEDVSRTYHLLSLSVKHEVNRVPSATLILRDGSASAESFELSNQPYFEPGKTIDILTGYRGEDEAIFKGIVVRHSIKLRKEGSVLTVECRDAAMKMTLGPKSAYFTDVKDSDVVEQIISAHSLQADVEDTSIQHPALVQYEATDWDFLMCRAEAAGLLCFVKDGKVSLKKPDVSAAPKLTIQHGATMRELDAEIDARIQFPAVAAKSWNPGDAELLKDVEADDPGLPAAGNLSAEKLAETGAAPFAALAHDAHLDEPELKSWADSVMLRQRLAKIRGSVRTDGNANVLPGDFIELAGVGERFEGALFVTGVRHQIEDGNWETIYQFGLDPQPFVKTYDVTQALAGGLLPPVQGLHTGIVSALEGDPAGEDRIQVRLPIIHESEEGVWARISTLDAGNARGTVFHPEINDEVLVGFLNNDPRHPVVLGGMHSSAKPAPITASDDNHQKGYVTRSKMKLLFDDDKKTVTIETPAGHSLLLSDDDQSISLQDSNGNKIVMSPDGISIESIKEVSVKAQTDFKAEASASATVKGSASAEFSSSGNTALKGGMVQIN